MEILLTNAAAWLDAVGIGGWARGGGSVYPLANTIHLLGLVLLVGAIGIVDLRILGLFPAIPLDPLESALTPLAVAGLAVLIASGTILFAADGAALAGSDTFHRKLVLIGIAVANAAAFRAIPRSARYGWGVRAMAVGSILLWLAVAALGRWIAYS